MKSLPLIYLLYCLRPQLPESRARDSGLDVGRGKSPRDAHAAFETTNDRVRNQRITLRYVCGRLGRPEHRSLVCYKVAKWRIVKDRLTLVNWSPQPRIHQKEPYD